MNDFDTYDSTTPKRVTQVQDLFKDSSPHADIGVTHKPCKLSHIHSFRAWFFDTPLANPRRPHFHGQFKDLTKA